MDWRLESLPELQHLSDSERSLLLSQCVGRMNQIRVWLVCLVRAAFFSVPITYFTGVLLNGGVSITRVRDFQFLFVFPISIVILTAIFYQIYMIRTRGQIRIYLHERKQAGEKLPVCLKCGYAITSENEHCPECGAAV